MATEIERKFRVAGNAWRRQAGEGQAYRQGYLSTDAERTVRVRVAGQQGYVTIKGKTSGMSRPEFEYTIPLADATEILETLCLRPLIEKIRYCLPDAGLTWEIDEFTGENQGLIIAEVELTEAHQRIEIPDWVKDEVTDDPRYFNANLVLHPFSQWR